MATTLLNSHIRLKFGVVVVVSHPKYIRALYSLIKGTNTFVMKHSLLPLFDHYSQDSVIFTPKHQRLAKTKIKALKHVTQSGAIGSKCCMYLLEKNYTKKENSTYTKRIGYWKRWETQNHFLKLKRTSQWKHSKFTQLRKFDFIWLEEHFNNFNCF